MKIDKVLKLCVIALILLFLAVFSAEKLGYYESQLSKKTSLTSEQIKIFEEDIKNGKDIDIDKYLEVNKQNYNNQISDVSLKVSGGIEKVFYKGIRFIFQKIDSAISE